MADTTLVEKLMEPGCNVNPHEFARELTELFAHKDIEGVRKLRDAYLIGVGRILPSKSVDEVQTLTDENLLYAAGLADIVAADGYESSGQLQYVNLKHGNITKFFKEAVGYNA